ncbi:hypothetical protein [Sphingomonas desiccabilis]|uniref:hypothetical protein n=1 Tax=Sphingomonas desiccabilis TaxID=429134 RepID=UPI0010123F67|nr:hypothetical protein [Sphingomonas desiccabilis]MBB3912094.1 putative anti-sigma-YlaC factor YlaD [Sphingomonas desiccabilis]
MLRKKRRADAAPPGGTARPLTLKAHASALLVAGVAGPLVSAFGSVALLLIAPGSAARMSLPNAAMVLCLLWIAIAFVAAPTAAVLLSALWPVTRRGTAAGRAVCVLAGITGGIVLASLGGKGSLATMLISAIIGAATAGVYCVVLARALRRRRAEPQLDTIFR